MVGECVPFNHIKRIVLIVYDDPALCVGTWHVAEINRMGVILQHS